MNSDQAINIIYNPYEENREKIKIVGEHCRKWLKSLGVSDFGRI